MTITLPYPPSANVYWRSIGRGRVLLSKEAREYKRVVSWEAVKANVRISTIPVDEVIVHLDIFRPQKSGDLDNRIKVCLDALKGIGFHDDKQVVEIHAKRFDDKSNPRVEVRIESI